jgi:cell wall-associated NlpC family hydrolase
MAIATSDVADLVGKPFAWGARGPHEFDCYGLVQEVCRRMGRRVPDFVSPEMQRSLADAAMEQQTLWTPVPCRPGAVALIEVKRRVDGHIKTDLGHVGVVLPGSRLIHCWEGTGGVTIEDLWLWERRIEGFYEFLQ